MDDLLINTIYSLLLITIRFSGLFFIAPLYSSRMIPAQVKAGFSLICSIIIFPIIFSEGLILFPDHPLQVVFHLLNELLVGLILGFVTFLAFITFQIAGRFLDMRMGFAMVNIIDPFMGEDAALIGQFKNILALIIFLVTNGHHQILKALVSSFQILPITKPVISNQLIEYIFRIGSDIFIIGFRLALPILATLFIVDLVFGFLARTVPQMNVFVLGFPVKILIGFLMLFLSMPYLVAMFIEVIQIMYQNMYQLLKIFKNYP
ncbi:MAG: flagellar type III secretion system protein FliR [Halanaerobiales bacterium]|nr:flagellar type III secretion system protein FliR [Halanaerobiales bacterium]